MQTAIQYGLKYWVYDDTFIDFIVLVDIWDMVCNEFTYVISISILNELFNLHLYCSKKIDVVE